MRTAKICMVDNYLKKPYQDWWLVHEKSNDNGYIIVGSTIITLPKEYVGKHIKLKVEVVEFNNEKVY